MATHAADSERARAGWRPRPFGLMLIAVADFLGAVGIGNLFLGQPAMVWLLAAGAVLLWGIATTG